MEPRIILYRTLLLFWSVYFSLVTASNLVNGLQEAGLVPSGWTFTSGNFALIVETVSIYGMSEGFAAVLFATVLLLELAVAGLFWQALRHTWRSPDGRSAKVIWAFVAAVGLFAGFLIADELFIVYDRIPNLESSHFLTLCALLLSLVVIHLQRHNDRAE